METKEINITEILKDCPKGTELYSPAFGKLKVYSICFTENKPILTEDKMGNRWSFCSNGRYSENSDEVMLFPSKDQRDWSKFKKPVVPPFEIKRVENGRYYYVIDSDLTVMPNPEFTREVDKVYFETGNYFNTEEQAEYAAEKVKELLLSMRKEVEQ